MSWLSFAISVIPRAVGNFAVMLLNCLLTLALNSRLALSRCAFGIFFDLELNSLIFAAFALRNWASFCFLLLVYCLRACVTPVCLRLPPLLLPPLQHFLPSFAPFIPSAPASCGTAAGVAAYA